MKRLIWAILLGWSSAAAVDVWLDSAFGPPESVIVGTQVRFGAFAKARYPAWGTVHFLLDQEGTRIYEDEENFVLRGGDSVLFDWPIIGLEPGHYTARDSLVVDLDPRDSTQVIWKFWVALPQPVAEKPRQRTAAGSSLPTHARGILWLPRSHRRDHWDLVSVTGLTVTHLRPGANDVSRVAPGVYFLRPKGPRGQGSQGASVRKVVVRP